jgi:DNA-binding NarL/FixJ family response regulator
MDNHLTKREQEVISILIKGKSNNEIAKKLHVSVNTVRTHLGSCYKKMNVKNRTELVIKYINK